MVDQARLQRLQRQRQRANKRTAQKSSSIATTKKKVGDTNYFGVATSTTIPATSINNSVNNYSSTNGYHHTNKQSPPRPPPNNNSNNTRSMPQIDFGGDGGSVEVIKSTTPTPYTNNNNSNSMLVTPIQSNLSSLDRNRSTPPPTPPVESSRRKSIGNDMSPKSMAVSKSIADSRRFRFNDGNGNNSSGTFMNGSSNSSSSKGQQEEWFQYTNGTTAQNAHNNNIRAAPQSINGDSSSRRHRALSNSSIDSGSDVFDGVHESTPLNTTTFEQQQQEQQFGSSNLSPKLTSSTTSSTTKQQSTDASYKEQIKHRNESRYNNVKTPTISNVSSSSVATPPQSPVTPPRRQESSPISSHRKLSRSPPRSPISNGSVSSIVEKLNNTPPQSPVGGRSSSRQQCSPSRSPNSSSRQQSPVRRVVTTTPPAWTSTPSDEGVSYVEASRHSSPSWSRKNNTNKTPPSNRANIGNLKPISPSKLSPSSFGGTKKKNIKKKSWSPTKPKQNKSINESRISICHHYGGSGGGTPVWVHASILETHSAREEDTWEWKRGYLYTNSDNSNVMSVTLHSDETTTSSGQTTYTISKKYNDGIHILMGNSWWSSSIDNQQTQQTTHPMPPNDLVELTHLHEPAIVHALRARYNTNSIYTYTGSILLALNPFKKLDSLYTRGMMELYWTKNDNTDMGMKDDRDDNEKKGVDQQPPPPHAFAVAERAYSSMIQSLEGRDNDNINNKSNSTNNSMEDEESNLCNQAILVSGESGAGKTVTTKIIMRYLSILSQRHSEQNNESSTMSSATNNGGGKGPSVEMQVLQSNPILESFGNARTIRNDNSSRFGKFIEMSFSAQSFKSSSQDNHYHNRQHYQQRGSLLGATIDTYLLEKVRLVSVNPGERNYHIFYELLSPNGMCIEEKQRYMLTTYFGQGDTSLTVNDFNMTSISGTFDRRDGVDDSDTYDELRTAMNTVGFSLDEQDGIFSVVSALLYASNLKFVNSNDGNDDCLVYDEDGTSEAVSNLLRVSEDSLKMALTTSFLEARGEILMKRLSASQAQKALEATVKATYGALFTYIVNRVNKSIEVQGDYRNINSDGSGGRRSYEHVSTIGVLDIFGFESFETNSFEQLCINYCNEALQQQFNRYVFKAEQAEYEYEGIEWSNIEFPDNQEALDLIEAKRVGIFSVLDEQCRLPRRTDMTFAKAVYDMCESNSYFEADRMQRSKGKFCIDHYAGKVEYDSDSFMLKNKDELPKSASDLLESSTVPLISELAYILSVDNDATPQQTSSSSMRDGGLHAPPKRSSSKLARSTVSGQFASQLKGLRSRIATTEPHYIRCLKPNDHLVANYFDEQLIAHQLNCAGVLPAMKIARAGFAMRYHHEAFIQRYRPIVYQELIRRRSGRIGGHQITCQFLISLLTDRLESEMRKRAEQDAKINDIKDIVAWGLQVGRSKVFLRSAASESLEELRSSTINKAATILQSRARAFICQNKFYLILGSILTLQCAGRKLIACVYVHQLRCEERSITLQKQWRSYYAWSQYQNTLYITSWCQRFYRGNKVRERVVVIKQYRSAIVIQSAWRAYTFQQCHHRFRSAAITIQCFLRRCAANRMLSRLKREMRDVKSIAMERDRLRQEMRQMKQELEQVKSRHNANDSIQQSDSFSSDKTGGSQEEMIALLSRQCAKKDHELKMLRDEVDTLRGSARSVPSTLLLTSGESSLPPTPLSRNGSFSPLGLALLASGESGGILPTSPSLLDTEVEVDDVPQLECSQVSSLPDGSMDITDEKVNRSSSLNQTESSFIDCMKIDELPFHQAILNDDKEMMLEEIQNASDDIELHINSTDSKGRTPLHVAAQCSNPEFAVILFSHHAVANTQDFSGNTALHYADSPEMTKALLEGGISPNIPNSDGLCALHLAVKRRDFMSAKYLLSYRADVNNADDAYWYTPLHLIAHAEAPLANTSDRSIRGPIAGLLCEAKVPSVPDLNYQDRDGNSPLHHAASLVEEDAGLLISLFIEHGSSPNITNNRGQTPVHLFCHNHGARQYIYYHEALHLMLAKGADTNTTSLSGCTALHLALYHQDVEAAALLIRYGAQVNMKWKKPQKWTMSWTDMGSDDVLPLDMLENIQDLHRVVSEISTSQISASRRARCMHCKGKFGILGRHHNCTHCGRSVCGRCYVGTLSKGYFPTLAKEAGNNNTMYKVCCLCEPILLSKMKKVVPPVTISVSGNGGGGGGGGCDQSSVIHSEVSL